MVVEAVVVAVVVATIIATSTETEGVEGKKKLDEEQMIGKINSKAETKTTR